MTKKALAQKLGISRSSLYYKKKQPLKDLKRYFEIKAVMDQNPAYGHERIGNALNISKNTAKRIMKKFDLKPKVSRMKPKYQAKKAKASYPNLIKDICPISPNMIWVSDFTWINYKQKFIYLATVLDVFTKQIVGYHVLKNHCTDLVKLALFDAIERSKSIPEILHSDQGSEYESNEFENLLKSLEIRISRSAVASPWQNGYQEAFFSHFKLELGNPSRFQHAGELIDAIHSQIDYYNQERIHSKLKTSPNKFFINYQQSLKDLKIKANC